MHNAFAQTHNPAYPYYGQPYHTYIPPGYTQQAPRSTFSAVQPSYASPPHSTPPDPWPREKVSFPQPTPSRQSPPSPFIPPNPDSLDAGHTPKPRPKRASTTKPKPVSEKPHPRSALKKNAIKRSDSLSAVPLERTRTSSGARQRLAPTTRTRTTSNPSFLPGTCFTHLTLALPHPDHAVISPDHMFVSFHGTNELRLGNVAYQDTLDEIKEHMMPMWPHGVSSQAMSSLSWRVTFSRNPWSATGSDAIM